MAARDEAVEGLGLGPLTDAGSFPRDMMLRVGVNARLSDACHPGLRYAPSPI
jgi:hypothetical protein